MSEAIKKYNTFSYTLTKFERVNDKMMKEKLTAKINANPLKVYLKQAMPHEGLEMLYIDGENDNKALINPNGFPK